MRAFPWQSVIPYSTDITLTSAHVSRGVHVISLCDAEFHL